MAMCPATSPTTVIGGFSLGWTTAVQSQQNHNRKSLQNKNRNTTTRRK